MKKIAFIILLSVISCTTKAQKITEYEAANDKVYHIGDSIKFTHGSAPNGDFLYIKVGNIVNADFKHNKLKKISNGVSVTIKEIEIVQYKGAKAVIFIVNSKKIGNCILFIDDAIAACEIADCDIPLRPIDIKKG